MSVSPLSRAGLLLLTSLLFVAGCNAARRDAPRFTLLDAGQTGIAFANTITTSDSVNVQTDPYVYNGAGVAVGDVDNDGLVDVFLSGNMVSSRLYRNEGDFRFEDITERAKVRTSRWVTGASMVDIDDDGWLDIYVSVSGPAWSTLEERANLLFRNNGNGTFTEEAERFGIADRGFTTHAVFLDYDGDNCLDLFLLENSPSDFVRADVAGLPAGMKGETPASYNQLYRNDCQGHFTNTSAEAGILREAGYGLGVAVEDLNRDRRPDLYVSNDLVTNDVVYVNNGDGTFTNKAASWLKHASFAGMGVDVADFNNDGWPDVMQVDMQPRDLDRQKRTSGFMTTQVIAQSRARGFRDDYSVNTLQFSNGVTRDGDVVFSEIAQLAGVARTDWSWAPLFADFDNDGLKDLFIGNGYPKAVNDLDYLSATLGAGRPGSASSSPQAARDALASLPGYEEPNYLYRNTGDLRFADVSKEWGAGPPSFSYGAAYADLDNDGSLDLVVNNIDAPAFVYRNTQRGDSTSHFLIVALRRNAPNRRAIGARVIVTAGGSKQHWYASPYRGYMSTMDDRAHFGLGRSSVVDSLEIFWPDGRYEVRTKVTADRLLVVQEDSSATLPPPTGGVPARDQPFEETTAFDGRSHSHETATLDYSVQPLLPYLISRQGPALAAADVNGDGLEDVFVGGAVGSPGRLFVQRRGGFVESNVGQPWTTDSTFEDWGARFIDANSDGLADLYVASGGYALGPSSRSLQDRLYINEGKGRFRRDTAALPVMYTSTSAIRAGDFNGDGRQDLFIAGRLMPRSYPRPTRSYVLRNDGGRFTDVTAELAPELAGDAGMITDAAWIDFDGDGRLDLVTVGEWMPIRFWRNTGDKLVDVTAASQLPPTRGWWFSLAAGDFDHDGRTDLVAGNLGLNASYSTSVESRFGIYGADFTGYQTADVVLTQEVAGVEYPRAGMAPLGRALYTLALKFPTFGSFSHASIPQLFDTAQLTRAVHYQMDTLASVFLHNEGGGRFTMTALPDAAQISPIRAIVAHDVDSDGNLDLIVAGNLYDTEPNTPRADAGNGLWLRGDGRGRFSAVSPRESGFLAPRNVSGLALIDASAGPTLLVANTGDALQAFTLARKTRGAGPTAPAPRAR